ncbi:hypothetical protein Y1Q_0014267 [Alligator mississippiensis]|uniref:Uncharacterized protein n=1 Tax=Alligator mississippiensis TaxID=8496 RepID=A0A151LZL0_ALLMI|nr:hypothetical protein Y1Q_0014267 [Alligator mississippiensis]
MPRSNKGEALSGPADAELETQLMLPEMKIIRSPAWPTGTSSLHAIIASGGIEAIGTVEHPKVSSDIFVSCIKHKQMTNARYPDLGTTADNILPAWGCKECCVHVHGQENSQAAWRAAPCNGEHTLRLRHNMEKEHGGSSIMGLNQDLQSLNQRPVNSGKVDIRGLS